MLTIWVVGVIISLIIDVVCYVAVNKYNIDIEYYHYTGEFKSTTISVLFNIFFAIIWPVMLVLTVMKLLEVK